MGKGIFKNACERRQKINRYKLTMSKSSNADESADIKELKEQVKLLSTKVEEMQKTQGKKPRKPRDPNAKPNPYVEFTKKKHAEFKKDGLHKDKNMSEKAKIIGELWKTEKEKSDN